MNEWQESRTVTNAKVRAIAAVARYTSNRGAFRSLRRRAPEHVFDAAGVVWQCFDVEALRTVVAYLCDCDPPPPAAILRAAHDVRRLLPDLAEREAELRPLLVKRFAATNRFNRRRYVA